MPAGRPPVKRVRFSASDPARRLNCKRATVMKSAMMTALSSLANTGLLLQASGGNVFTYFGNSNFAGKLIVVALMAFSILAWSVMLGKYLDLKRLRGLNHGFERKLSELETLFQFNPKAKISGPYATLLRKAMEAHLRFGGAGADPKVRMGHIENALERAVSRACLQYEEKMVLLSSIVTAAPFMGLLGTVWGVMDAFGNLGLQSTATLQALAPGVSGALLTTVAGLLVAIPSVLGYNFLLTQSKLMVTELENFASMLADRMELEMATHDV